MTTLNTPHFAHTICLHISKTGGGTTMSVYGEKTLGDLLSDPRIQQVAPDAVRDLDLVEYGVWDKTLNQLKAEHFGGGLERGFTRLFSAVESGKWFYPLYEENDCLADPAKKGVYLVWFPAQDPAASEKPYVLLVPGGGFVNVWNLTEGWPIAAQFNELGYNVFVLTYRVTGENRLQREMEDFAQAVRFIQAHADSFHVCGDRYITCGFSAGGYLVCLWNTLEKGYAAFGLPRPEAVIPVYPFVSWKKSLLDHSFDPDSARQLLGCDIEVAAESAFEIPDHAEGFPPCAIFLAAGDTLVPPDHSRLLAHALESLQIPCRLEIGPTGGHGFADGTDTCMEGWTGRAVQWIESLKASS